MPPRQNFNTIDSPLASPADGARPLLCISSSLSPPTGSSPPTPHRGRDGQAPLDPTRRAYPKTSSWTYRRGHHRSFHRRPSDPRESEFALALDDPHEAPAARAYTPAFAPGKRRPHARAGCSRGSSYAAAITDPVLALACARDVIPPGSRRLAARVMGSVTESWGAATPARELPALVCALTGAVGGFRVRGDRQSPVAATGCPTGAIGSS